VEGLAAIRICCASRGNCCRRNIPKDAAILAAYRAGYSRSRRGAENDHLSVPVDGRPAPNGLEESGGREDARPFEVSPADAETSDADERAYDVAIDNVFANGYRHNQPSVPAPLNTIKVGERWDFAANSIRRRCRHRLGAHGLRRDLLADSKLRKVFGKDKVTMFEMNKHLTRHLK
jgi:hypothetical protein